MKKLMAVIAALAVALTLTSCDFLGKGKTSGTKWNKKMTVDGTSITNTYRRFIKKLSVSEKVTDLTTKIIIDKENSVLSSDDGKAVVGLAFDFHSTGTGTNKEYDFVLIGFRPTPGANGTNTAGKLGFYIEKYEGIKSDKASSAAEAMSEDKEDEGSTGFDTNDSSMGEGNTPQYKSFTGAYPMTLGGYIPDDWKELPTEAYEDKEKTFEIDVKIEQKTAGTYDIYLGDKKVATYNGEVKCTDAKDKNNNGKCWGGAAVYANTPKGCKVVVKYQSDKEATKGLFADEDEF